jgi:NADP-dependent 3-hydroxy acid dehydrogenase YdfG
LKTVIVTGASSGIGKVTVIRLAGSGYKVFGLARNYDALKSINAENYTPVEFDITKPERFDAVVESILASSDGIYGLVNNAGYVEPGAVEDISMESIRIRSSLRPTFLDLWGLPKRFCPTCLNRIRAG